MRTLVWFRGKDLRLADHAPLRRAAKEGEVIPVFVLDPYFFAPRRAREFPHRMQYLLQSLTALQSDLRKRGSDLIVVRGKSTAVIPRLANRWRVDQVVAHRWCEPFGRERDRCIAAGMGIPLRLFEGETLVPPGTLRSGSGRPYAVFTPFARAFRAVFSVGDPQPAPRRLSPLPDGLGVRPVPIPGLHELGIPLNERLLEGGEKSAQKRLRRFLAGPVGRYHTNRNRMDLPGTSRLSADLKFGTVSIRTVWAAVTRAPGNRSATRAFSDELLWREFTHSTLWDHPHLLERPFRPEFQDFPWRFDRALWDAWVEGRTGYPVVDAAARQLLTEGFVHNRARMIAASFLTKHLLIHYQHGEAHYLRYLTDGDWAQNNAGWQWSAGCGCDAQPYFRVFNPVLQGQRFDPTGDYVRAWVAELAGLPTRFIHRPWQAPAAVLQKVGVRLDRDYPRPIVDHAEARARFLGVANQHLSAVRRSDLGA